MVYCLFCKKKYKTKKAYKSHAQSSTHLEKEKEIKRDKEKYKKLFITNFCTFIHKYDTHKKIEDVYKEYIQDNIISYKDVGYTNISFMIPDLKTYVDVIETDNKFMIKCFDQYKPEKKTIEDESSSLSSDIAEMSDYEEFDGNQDDLISIIQNLQ